VIKDEIARTFPINRDRNGENIRNFCIKRRVGSLASSTSEPKRSLHGRGSENQLVCIVI